MRGHEVASTGEGGVKLPAQLTLRDYQYLLDGGTTELSGTDEAGCRHVVALTAHLTPRGAADGGRLYFDGELIDIRSDDEAGVLDLLRTATVQGNREPPPANPPNVVVFGDDIKRVMSRSDSENIRELTAQVIEFVDSNRYLEFEEQVRKAKYPARFTVRVKDEPDRRQQIIVWLSRALRLSVVKARKRFDEDRVIGVQVTAVRINAVADLVANDLLEVEGLEL